MLLSVTFCLTFPYFSSDGFTMSGESHFRDVWQMGCCTSLVGKDWCLGWWFWHIWKSHLPCAFRSAECNFPYDVRAQRICSSEPPLSGAAFSNTAQISTELMVMPEPPPGVESLWNSKKERCGLGAAAVDTKGKLLIWERLPKRKQLQNKWRNWDFFTGNWFLSASLMA